MFGPTLQRSRLKNFIDQYKNTLLNIIENELIEDKILFDEYINNSHSPWLFSMSKFISDLRWIEQLRQRIKNQIEPLKLIDIKTNFNIKNNDIYNQILEQERNLQKQLDDFIANTHKQWIQSFQNENFLHLNESLLRKEDQYYFVNIKSEVNCKIERVYFFLSIH
jgi:hypothetical protein